MVYIFKDFNSIQYFLGEYSIFMLAKSGRPVLGQIQVNSGIAKHMIYDLSGY